MESEQILVILTHFLVFLTKGQSIQSKNFYSNFLEWKLSQSLFQFEDCLSLNFDHFVINLSIPQISITPESQMNLTFDFPASCLMVMVGGKYLNRIGAVMEKVNSITNDVGRTRTLAVFIKSNDLKRNIIIDVNYGLDRLKSTPVMVNSYRYNEKKFCNCSHRPKLCVGNLRKPENLKKVPIPDFWPM